MGRDQLSTRYDILSLNKSVSRNHFSCGVEALDHYLKRYAFQDINRQLASVFVIKPRDSENICGFYSLSMASISLNLLPRELGKKLPGYPQVPAVRLGRLAVDQGHQRLGLGEHLLMDAIHRCCRSEIAWNAMIVDAKDDNSKDFYQQYGFIAFEEKPLALFIAQKTLASVFG
jgi:ribosomal protein S18 acetylase RimI-like enzyme